MMTLLWIVAVGFAWFSMARLSTLLTWAIGEKYQIATRETRYVWDKSKIEYETVVWSLPIFGRFEEIKDIKEGYSSCIYDPIHLAKMNLFLWPLALPHTIFRAILRVFGFRGRTTGSILENILWGNMIKGLTATAQTIAKPIENKEKR